MITNSRQGDVSALFASATLLPLLRAFVSEPERDFYQRELQRLTSAHLRQVQRDLLRLENAGLVTRRAHGNRTYYRAVGAHPSIAALQGLVDAAEPAGAARTPTWSAPRARAGSAAARLGLDQAAVAAFCRRWGVTELSLFGSVLRSDFDPESDVDVLATFAPDARRSLFDYAAMRDELAAIVGRQVDLVNREAVERGGNQIRRRSILASTELVYAA
jgi:predicted nucleotidyltransferase